MRETYFASPVFDTAEEAHEQYMKEVHPWNGQAWPVLLQTPNGRWAAYRPEDAATINRIGRKGWKKCDY